MKLRIKAAWWNRKPKLPSDLVILESSIWLPVSEEATKEQARAQHNLNEATRECLKQLRKDCGDPNFNDLDVVSVKFIGFTRNYDEKQSRLSCYDLDIRVTREFLEKIEKIRDDQWHTGLEKFRKENPNEKFFYKKQDSEGI